MPAQREKPEGHDTVVSKNNPCPTCGLDAVVKYADGHEHCFAGCGYHKPSNGNTPVDHPKGEGQKVTGLLKAPEQRKPLLKKRGISEATLRKFGYFAAPFNRQIVEVAPYYDDKGVLVAQKLRDEAKSFPVLFKDERVKLAQLPLWGFHVYGSKFDRKIVITEGEHDAMAVDETMKGKIPAVSLTAGISAAVANIKANYTRLIRFKEIILYFDDDEPGQKAAQEVAAIFDPGKVKIARVPGFKDASDARQAGKGADIENAIWTAVEWRPRGIINAMEGKDEFLSAPLRIPSFPFPINGVQESSMGLRLGETWWIVGGTGTAKTTIMHDLAQFWGVEYVPTEEHDLPRPKIGFMGFEDTTRDVKLGILSAHKKQPLHIDPIPKEELDRLYDHVFGEGRFELFDPEHADYSFEGIASYIKYMARALDCKIIFLDPFSIIAARLGGYGGMTEKEAAAVAEIAVLFKSLNIAGVISHHLRKNDGEPFEEGAQVSLDDLKGAGAISQYAHNVSSLERDQRNENPEDRPDLMKWRNLKVRKFGRGVGKVTMLKYDMKRGVYRETTETWPDKDDKKKKGGKQPSGFNSESPQEY